VTGQPAGVVVGLTRYPVKSLAGEELAVVEVGPRGLAGDRCWAVYTEDGGIGSGKTTRRFRRVDGLLELQANLAGSVPVVNFPSGPLAADDAAANQTLSTVLGRPLELRPEGDVPHHDESPVHVITSAALRSLGRVLGGPVDPVRFRANVVLDTDGADCPEDGWVGRELCLGEDVVLRIGPGMPRCRMVDLPQWGLGRDGRILQALADGHDLTFGVQARVVRGGTVRTGEGAVLV
jgi:uncharacterized protein